MTQRSAARSRALRDPSEKAAGTKMRVYRVARPSSLAGTPRCDPSGTDKFRQLFEASKMRKTSLHSGSSVRTYWQRIFFAAFLLATLAGCTSLRTSEEPVGGQTYASDRKARVGLHYFLPKAFLTIEGKEAGDDKQVFMVSVSRTIVADQRHRYHLRWTQNPFYDDKVSGDNGITVNAQGLLTAVDMSSTDQTPAIAGDLATTAVNVFRILGRVGGTGQQGGKRVTPGVRKDLQPFKYTFDPLDASETRRVTAALNDFGINMIVVYPNSGVTQSAVGDAMAAGDSKNGWPKPADIAKDNPRSGGVFYHPPTTVELCFDFRPRADVIHREAIMVPDPERVACFRFGRSPLVKRDTTLALTDGMPTGFKIERPSTVKAFTGALSAVTGIVADAIPTIVNVRVNRQVSDLNAQTSLATAQAGLATQRKATLDSEKALADAIAAANAAAAGGNQRGLLDENDTAGKFESARGPQSGKVRTGPIKFEGTVTMPPLPEH